MPTLPHHHLMPRVNGTTTARGYGAAHQRARRQALEHLRANPGHPCWRCGAPLHYDDRAHIDLGHDDNDRTQYRGLECATCNRATSTRKNQGQRPPPNSEAW